ncbi:MAG: hypothetical protein ACRDRU_13525 [Pseudonocardiaceae bacterium]
MCNLPFHNLAQNFGGRLIRIGRRQLLNIDPAWPWAREITTAHARLTAFAAP